MPAGFPMSVTSGKDSISWASILSCRKNGVVTPPLPIVAKIKWAMDIKRVSGTWQVLSKYIKVVVTVSVNFSWKELCLMLLIPHAWHLATPLLCPSMSAGWTKILMTMMQMIKRKGAMEEGTLALQPPAMCFKFRWKECNGERIFSNVS